MYNIWITYCWKDNKNQDIDFIAQELENAGLNIKLDKWNITTGKRLWTQIENFIGKPSKSDAWIFIITNNSLQSEACKEEFSYALQRTLENRGEIYPIIGLFISEIDNNLIPMGIKTRLYVSITDPYWIERICSSVENREPLIPRVNISSYYIKVHNLDSKGRKFIIEVRPRAGIWAPFFFAIPIEEKNSVDPFILPGPKDCPTDTGIITGGKTVSKCGNYWVMTGQEMASPMNSYYVWCKKLPSKIIFGVKKTEQYTCNLDRDNYIKFD